MRAGWFGQGAGDRALLVDSDVRAAPDQGARLLHIVAEAVILQDEAEAVLAAVVRHEHLGVVAPRGGPLVGRFFALRQQLPARCDDPELDRWRSMLDTIFHHHAMQLATALDFLALDRQSEQFGRQISGFAGLGTPAALLEDLYRELKNRDREAGDRPGPGPAPTR